MGFWDSLELQCGVPGPFSVADWGLGALLLEQLWGEVNIVYLSGTLSVVNTAPAVNTVSVPATERIVR